MILVAGATGELGGIITRRLLEQGNRVRVLVRDGSRFDALVEEGAEPVIGDLREPGSLARACAGVGVVVTTANSARRGGHDTPESVDLAGNHDLVDAAAAAGVRQFVFVSARMADPASPVPLLRAKALTEAHLRRSGMPFTILAPDVFMDTWIPMVVGVPAGAGLRVTLVGQGGRRHAFVAVADVASFAVAALGHPMAIDRRLEIGGPDALSWGDVVRAHAQASGRPIEVRHVAPGQSLPGLPETVSGLMAALETFDSPIDMTETARTFGIAPTSLSAWMRVHMAVAPEPIPVA